MGEKNRIMRRFGTIGHIVRNYGVCILAYKSSKMIHIFLLFAKGYLFHDLHFISFWFGG